jgi:hypothetical protein
MLFEKEYLPYTCTGLVIITLILYICAKYAYHVNARRPDDDPQKRDFRTGYIFPALFLWPFFLLAYIAIFALRALLYILFLILFPIILLVLRKPPQAVWLHKIATSIGDKLLEANTFLIKALVMVNK